MAVVVLPTPPFWFAIAMTRAIGIVRISPRPGRVSRETSTLDAGTRRQAQGLAPGNWRATEDQNTPARGEQGAQGRWIQAHCPHGHGVRRLSSIGVAACALDLNIEGAHFPRRLPQKGPAFGPRLDEGELKIGPKRRQNEGGGSVARAHVDDGTGKQRLGSEYRKHECVEYGVPGLSPGQIDPRGPALQTVEIPLELRPRAGVGDREESGEQRGTRVVTGGQGVLFAFGNRCGEKYIARPCCTMAARLDTNQ